MPVFVCEHEGCERTFTIKSQRKRHMRVHTGEKPYKCDVCDAAFTQSNSLRNHMNIHLDKKPYECSYCKRGFKDKSTCNRHERIHDRDHRKHRDWYRCHYKDCTREYSRPDALKIHVKTQHKMAPERYNYSILRNNATFRVDKVNYGRAENADQAESSLYCCFVMDCYYVSRTEDKLSQHLQQEHSLDLDKYNLGLFIFYSGAQVRQRRSQSPQAGSSSCQPPVENYDESGYLDDGNPAQRPSPAWAMTSNTPSHDRIYDDAQLVTYKAQTGRISEDWTGVSHLEARSNIDQSDVSNSYNAESQANISEFNAVYGAQESDAELNQAVHISEGGAPFGPSSDAALEDNVYGWSSEGYEGQSAPSHGGLTLERSRLSVPTVRGTSLQMNNLESEPAYDIQEGETVSNLLGLINEGGISMIVPTNGSVYKSDVYGWIGEGADIRSPLLQGGMIQDHSRLSISAPRSRMQGASPMRRPRLRVDPSAPYQSTPQLTRSTGRSQNLRLPSTSQPITPYATTSAPTYTEFQNTYQSDITIGFYPGSSSSAPYDFNVTSLPMRTPQSAPQRPVVLPPAQTHLSSSLLARRHSVSTASSRYLQQHPTYRSPHSELHIPAIPRDGPDANTTGVSPQYYPTHRSSRSEPQAFAMPGSGFSSTDHNDPPHFQSPLSTLTPLELLEGYAGQSLSGPSSGNDGVGCIDPTLLYANQDHPQPQQ